MVAEDGKNGQGALGDAIILVADAAGPLILYPDGAGQRLAPGEVVEAVAGTPTLLCNAALTERRLGFKVPHALDVLELAVFVCPAEAIVPTIGGLARLVGLEPAPSAGLADQARQLRDIALALLSKVGRDDYKYVETLAVIAGSMARAGWAWAPLLSASGLPSTGPVTNFWEDLPVWEEGPPPEAPSQVQLDPSEVLGRLERALGEDAETRPDQRSYAEAVSGIFGPRAHEAAPNLVLAEAETGIGKTLGYLAPASLWAEKADGTVWISTFTKNLQRQLDQELSAVYRDAAQKSRRATIRKGRENYLCMMNLEESVAAARNSSDERRRIFLGLVLRWLRYTRDGDMVGGDFPRWLTLLFPASHLTPLTDRRGECIYSACGHYKRCFIERARRKARDSHLVIANHAVTMVEAANRRDDPVLPRHFIFDEGHHLFGAADSAFALHITGREGLELRRWLLGGEARRSARAKGLRARLDDIVGGDMEAMKLLQEALQAATALPAEGWMRRIQGAQPAGPFEAFLMQTRSHIFARSGEARTPHGLEATADQPSAELVSTVEGLLKALKQLSAPLTALAAKLHRKLDQEASSLSSGDRARIEAATRALVLRAEMVRQGWCLMLEAISGAVSTPETHIDWFALDRTEGREFDTGLHRHWIDPTIPFAETVLEPAHGVCVTSATLRDRVRIIDGEEDWSAADTNVGANHLPTAAVRKSFPSPFDFARQSRILIVTDVNKNDPEQVAAAYRELFLAAGGGALGLFTAIQRLRGVYERLEGPLHESGLSLYAQHVDPLDPGTLVDIFRDEPGSCLLGTDALRDGVDVPGHALRLIVFDRVPWPRPTIMHRARRAAFGGRAYDETLVRMRLKQAFGRLIRRATDRGAFVLLDAATPTRLLEGLPETIQPKRLGLREAIDLTHDFLAPSSRKKSTKNPGGLPSIPK
ncbi:MAG: ATP-dependent DNA helicase [Sphingomonadales bacterium]